MRFGILGPLEVHDAAGRPVAVSGAKRRALLARLLVDQGRAVPADRLADDLWDEAPPPGFAATLQSHVSHLRRLIGDRIRHVGGCYVLDLAGDDVDAAAFEAHLLDGQARLRAGDARGAAEVLDAGLALWRGPALLDVADRTWAAPAAARLEELRLQGHEAALQARLDAGAHADVAARAEALVREHPFRERLCALLVTALYRDGRQAEALQAYDRLRRDLADDLGLDPSPELRALEHAVLTQDPALAAPRRDPQPPDTSRPSGTVTFLFTDIEGSTALWESAPAAMQHALATHDTIVRGAIERAGGRVFATGGDGFAAAFPSARAAVDAALAARSALDATSWEAEAPIRVRMALHSGEAVERDGDYLGPPVNRAARLVGLAHAGQILCSSATAELLGDTAGLVELGSYALKGVAGRQRVLQVGDGSFPAIGVPERRTNIAVPSTPLMGRVEDLHAVVRLLSSARLVTLTGFGGIGKTRLALAVAAELATTVPDGCWVVELGRVAAGQDLLPAVAAALGLGAADRDSLRRYVADRRLLLVLDNCEHVVEDAADLAEDLLRAGPELAVLATSREALGVPAEVVHALAPLEVPHPDADAPEAARSDAVRLFIDRAGGAVVLDETTVGPVVEICRRLDGLPLAIELAAAQTAALPVTEIARRLDERFRLLGTGRRGEQRHRTLEAVASWSYDALAEQERAVFRRLSVFPTSFDLQAAEAVTGGADEDVVGSLVALVQRSLVTYDDASGRYSLLESLREYGARRLAEAGETAQAEARHAAHYAGLATSGDDRARSELDNVRAAVVRLMARQAWSEVFALLHDTWRHWIEDASRDVFFSAYADAIDRHVGLSAVERADALGRLAFAAHWCRGPDAVLELAQQARAAAAHLPGCGFWGEAGVALATGMSDSRASAAAAARATAIAESAAMPAEAAFATALHASALRDLGQPDEAGRLVDQALVTARRATDRTLLRSTYLTSASVRMWPGPEPDFAAGRALLAELDALGQLAPIQRCWADVYAGMAVLDTALPDALAHLTRAIVLADEHHIPGVTPVATRLLAVAAGRLGRLDLAAQLGGFARSAPAPVSWPFERWIAQNVTSVLSQLPAAERAEQEAAGAQLTRRRFLHLVDLVAAS